MGGKEGSYEMAYIVKLTDSDLMERLSLSPYAKAERHPSSITGVQDTLLRTGRMSGSILDLE